MRIEIKNGNNNETRQKQRIVLDSETILRYLIGKDDKIDTLIMCKGNEIDLAAMDFNVYEALASVKPYDDFKLNKLAKFFEVVDVLSYRARKGEKPIIKDDRVEELRKKALSKER